MTTTAQQIRDQQASLVEALVPNELRDMRFREFDRHDDFREWAADNKRAALRRFRITDLLTYETPEISDLYKQQETTNFEVVVSYPADQRFGDQEFNGLSDAMRSDMRQIDTAIGLHGLADYVPGQWACILQSSDVERDEDVWFLVLEFEVTFYRRTIASTITVSDRLLGGTIVAVATSSGSLILPSVEHVLSGTIVARAEVPPALFAASILSGTAVATATTSGTLVAPPGALIADLDFRTPLSSWTAGAVNFASTFATDQWEMQDLASPMSNSGSVGVETLASTGLVAQEAIGVNNGTDSVSHMAWECTSGTQELMASGTTAGDSDNENLSGRIVFRCAEVPAVADYAMAKRGTSGAGWAIQFSGATVTPRIILVDDLGNTVTLFAETGDYGDGAYHYLSFLYNAGTNTISVKTDRGETTASTAILSGSLTNSLPLFVNSLVGASRGLQKAQYVYAGVSVGTDAQSMYNEDFWQHAQDPSSVLTSANRGSLISVPVANGKLSHFAGGTTLDTCQMPVGFHSGLNEGLGGSGLYIGNAVANLVPYSELSTGATNSSMTATDDAVDGPDGFRSTTEYSATAAGGYSEKVCSTTGSTEYTGSALIRGASSGETGRLVMYDLSNGAELAATSFVASAVFNPVTVTGSTVATGLSTGLRLELDTAADTVAAACWQLEEGDARTGYVRTTSGVPVVTLMPVYRANGDHVQETRGEVRVEATCIKSQPLNSLFSTNSGSDLRIVTMQSANRIQCVVRNGSSGIEHNATPASVFPNNSPIDYRLAWDESPFGVGGDGVRAVSFDATNGVRTDSPASPWTAPSGGDFADGFYLGSTNVSTRNWNGYIERLRLFDAKSEVF